MYVYMCMYVCVYVYVYMCVCYIYDIYIYDVYIYKMMKLLSLKKNEILQFTTCMDESKWNKSGISFICFDLYMESKKQKTE